MLTTKIDDDERGDVRLTVQIVGIHDYFRFALNMLDDQVEFSREGNKVLAALRERMGRDRFEPMARSMLGDKRYEELSGWGFFEYEVEGVA